MVMLLLHLPLVVSSGLLFGAALLAVAATGAAFSRSVEVWTWAINLTGSSDLEFSVVLDYISYSFLGSVGAVAGAVLVFSRTYMQAEKFFVRFHFLIISFVAAMALLILSPNLLSVLLGWDGLGVTSFLLVVYFQSTKASNAGMLTVLTNRLGDLFILAAIGLQASEGSWSLFNPSLDPGFRTHWSIVVLVVLAAFTKSAQIPFSAWLPAAMAAPTPVSSLVHSSTLVTAGVYLLIRLTLALEAAGVLSLVLIIGTCTMFMAGVSALMEPDMKKVVALSTLSQLGLMVSALGLGLWKTAFLHLLSHAYFKALLFMAVGNMIHLSDDFQDSRKASMSKFNSISLAFSGVANFSLCGLPFMSGFFTKDLILEMSLSAPLNMSILIVFFLATGMTAAYSVRLTLMCWWSSSRKSALTWENDSDPLIFWCCAILWPLAISGGALLVKTGDLFNGCLSMSLGAKNLTLFVVTAGGLTGYFLSALGVFSEFKPANWGWGSMWALPFFSSATFSELSVSVAKMVRLLDSSWASFTPSVLMKGDSAPFSLEYTWPKVLSLTGFSLALVFMLSAVLLY